MLFQFMMLLAGILQFNSLVSKYFLNLDLSADFDREIPRCWRLSRWGSMHWSLVFILLATNVLQKKSEIIHRIRLQPMNRDVGFYSSSTASILIHFPATNNHLNRKKPLRCKFLKQCRQEMENRPHRKDGNGSRQ